MLGNYILGDSKQPASKPTPVKAGKSDLLLSVHVQAGDRAVDRKGDKVRCIDLLCATYHREISPEYSLEGLVLKLKVQYFGHLMGRTDSLEKTLMLGKIEVGRRKGTTEDEMVGWHH